MTRLKEILHQFFIPSEKNNYRAKSLHTHFLTYYLIAAILVSFSYKGITKITDKVLGVATDITISKLFELTNNQRQQNGLAPLTFNDTLSQAAQAKAQNMFAHNYWAHYGPDGASPWDFILGAGYKYEYAGENLAKDFMYSQDVVQAWMDSPTHRENILKPNYTDIGFAVSNGILNGEETTLVVQMFGKPLTSQTAVAQAAEITPSPTRAPIVTSAAAPVISNVVSSPTLLPSQPITSPSQLKGQILTSTRTKPLSHLNFQTIFYGTSFIFFIFLMISLVFDLYFTHHLSFNRRTGKHIAHFIFLGGIIIALLLIAKGTIL